VYNSAAETASVTASQSGTLTGMTSSSLAIKWVAYSTQFAPTIGFNSLDTTYAACTGTCTGDVAKDARITRTTQTFRVSFDNSLGTTDKVTFITFTDNDGKATGAAGTSGSLGVAVSDLAPWTISTASPGTGKFFAVFPLLQPSKKYMFTIMINATRNGYPGEIRAAIVLASGLTGLKSSSITSFYTKNVGVSSQTTEIMFHGTISVGVDVDSIKLTANRSWFNYLIKLWSG
ncbi:MAG: hypothetical protein EBY68_01275, partial [Actinobacteria bacterium]|nr:hypothetical protein [Actinomycetota bacterium]